VVKVRWKQCLAIKRLGLSRYGLQLKIRRLGIHRPDAT
jgi:hypothetical protein